MEKTAWAVKWADFGGKILDELLYEHWEPFAITEISPGYKVWLRKIVRVEVKSESEG